MLTVQRNSLKDYYAKTTLIKGHFADPGEDQRFIAAKERIFEGMERYASENPDAPTALLKSRLYTLMAENCDPVIFDENPFFFEIGLREAQSWGISFVGPATWVRRRRDKALHEKHPILSVLKGLARPIFDLEQLGLGQADCTFDGDHHTLGYTLLFRYGVQGLMEQAKSAPHASGSDEAVFCQAVVESLQAILAIAEKFALKAEEMLQNNPSPRQKKFLSMIAENARIIPAQPPKTFYQGLAMLLFMREAAGTLEGLGISQLGHADRLLGPLYEHDLALGLITEEEARELIGIWMLHTDIKFDLEHASWPETSTCIQLGGCDEDGNPVYNTVTKMFMEEHHRLGLLNPKLNCRYNAQTPDEFFTVAGKAILAGHNNFVMINDDIIISGLVRSGVDERDARLYVSGGCQETMIEGFGHTEGVAFYASVPRVLDLFLHPTEQSRRYVPPVENPESFEDFLEQFMHALDYFFALMIDQRNMRQSIMKDALICPLFSATQSGCIASGKDYTHGGAKYNFSTISLCGLGTAADSLYAVKELVYERRQLSLPQLAAVLASDWEGEEALRQQAIALPKYGHNHPEADALTNRFFTRFADLIRVHKNERGGTYIPSLFVYYHYESFARSLRATPDGRKAFELLSPGAAPSQLRTIRDITVPVKSMSRIDFTSCGGGSSVLDMKLPLSSNMTPELFGAYIRACGQLRCPTLQPNVVSQEELLDAKIHPEKHKNLIVRICGLSGYFVALTPKIQDEIIARNQYEM